MDHDKKKIENIVKWREQLSLLPDHHFFEIMRMYLGEVKTPYNKQKLIEELSSFLRKDETKKNIKLLLTPNDTQILSAIEHIPNATQNTLLDFFSKKFTFAQLHEELINKRSSKLSNSSWSCSKKFTFAQLHEELLNLEERLLIFRFIDKKKVFFSINPLLYETLEPVLGVNTLFADDSISVDINLDPILDLPKIPLSSNFLGALISFLTIEKGFVKADNNFRKRSLAFIKTIFPNLYITNSRTEEPVFLRAMINALRHLHLISWENGTITQNHEKWQDFANLPEIEQYSYLTAAAACNRPSRTIITNYAQLIYSILKLIPQEGLSLKMLNRIIFLISKKTHNFQENTSSARLNSLFGQPIVNDEAPCSNDGDETDLLKNDKKNLIEKMFLFSLLECVDNKIFVSKIMSQSQKEGHFLRADGGFSISVFPEIRLKNLLSVIQFLNIVSFDVVSKYEITKQSCQRAFDNHLTPKDILPALEANMNTPVNQTVQFSIEDWFKSYSKVALYRGYILELPPEKVQTITASKLFKTFLEKNFTDNLYLMNFDSDEEAIRLCQKMGLEFITSVKSKKKDVGSSTFRNLYFSADLDDSSFLQPKNNDSNARINEQQQEFLNNIQKALHEKKLPHEQSEILESRIKRRIILSADQLRSNSVRFEVNEAQGIDFLGKVRIIEYAISIDSMVELQYEDSKEPILGVPLSTEKREGDVILKMQVEPENEIKLFSIGKAAFVKRIRGAIFKETRT
ncbi:MAG: hypothetical protein ACRC4W_04670 [Treponemataceae bacterium]